MTIPQFKKWLEQQIQYLGNLDQYQTEDQDARYVEQIYDEAYASAVDLNLTDCIAAWRPGLPGLMAMLDAIDHGDTFTPPQVAEQLGVSPDTVRGWINRRQLTASNVAQPGKRPRWKVKREDLDAFLEKRQPDEAPPKRRKPRLLVQRY